MGIAHSCETIYNTLLDAMLLNPPPVYGFIDNKYAIEATEGTINSNANIPQLTSSRSALKSLRSLTTVTLGWLPGHSKIWGNEVSDLLAKDGANGIASRRPPSSDQLIEIKNKCVFQSRQEAHDAYPEPDNDLDIIELADDIPM